MGLLFAGLTRAAGEHRERRETDEHVDNTYERVPLAEHCLHEVPVKETDKTPVQRTDNDQYPRELVHAAESMTHHKREILKILCQ